MPKRSPQCWLVNFGTSALGDSVLSREKAREEAIVLMLLREGRLFRLRSVNRSSQVSAHILRLLST